MANVIFEEEHIFRRMGERYSAEDRQSILGRVISSLQSQAPEDWRFTQSPSARFFVIDLASQTKILGLSYRNSGQKIVLEIQKGISEDAVPTIIAKLNEYIYEYLKGLSNPEVPVCHHLRTAYPKTKGEIGEEKTILSSIKDNLNHIVLLQEKKISARPNAVVLENGKLWVRQHLNWMGMEEMNIEYFLFEQLTPLGVDRSKRKIFSYTTNGDLREREFFSSCPIKDCQCFLNVEKKMIPERFRTDTYWTLPTFLDCRLMDLDYREREPQNPDDGPLNRNELVELYIFRKIVDGARKILR